MDERYKDIWMARVGIKAMRGHTMSDLVYWEEGQERIEYIGAIANVLLHADTIFQALEIIKPGFAEKYFEVDEIDMIENFQSIYDRDELDEEIVSEADELKASEFVFIISGKLFCYTDQN